VIGTRRAAAACGWAAVAAVTACAGVAPPPPPPAEPPGAAAERAWPAVLAASRTAAAARDFRAAESTLVAFARRHPDSVAGAEATYHWALLRLDPAQRGADRGGVLAVLDAYRGGDPGRPHAAEAAVLRSLIVQQDSLRSVLTAERAAAAAATTAAVGARAGLVPRDSLRVRDEEIARLRIEAATAQAELDRVRRRLGGTPGPRPRRP
jgi:hypothetical protein